VGYRPRQAERTACAPRNSKYPAPAHLIALKTGWEATISAPNPTAAAAPCTAFELATPTPAHAPRRRPAASALRDTTAKSGPGTSTNTTANTRKEP
jgi:hypothetical protein